MKKTEFLNTRKKIEQKNHGMIDKVTTLDQAVNLINNGDTIALGGCLYSRTPIAMIREIIKKKLTDLTIIRNLVSLEGDWLLASNCLKKIITSWYSIGVTWGVSKVMRDYMENKKAIYDLTVDKKENKIGTGVYLENFNILLLPDYIIENKDKFLNWIDQKNI